MNVKLDLEFLLNLLVQVLAFTLELVLVFLEVVLLLLDVLVRLLKVLHLFADLVPQCLGELLLDLKFPRVFTVLHLKFIRGSLEGAVGLLQLRMVGR